MPDVAALDDVMRTTEAIIGGVRADQSQLPTPCPEYDVATLVDHMVKWIGTFADATDQATASQPTTEHQTDADPAATFHHAGQRLTEAFREGAADRQIDLGNGPSPGSMILGMILMEYIGHGWDLAVATGQPASYSAHSIEAAHRAAQANLKPEYRGLDKSFGEVVAVDADAPPLDQLIGLLGRDPDRAAASL